MRLLIGIMSCHRDKWFHRVLRETWVGQWSSLVDVRFFVGRPILPVHEADEIYLDVPDGYQFDLTLKFQQMIAYALGAGYDFLFRCDTDTYVHVPRLLASKFWEHDYVGNAYLGRSAQGGPGLSMGRKAMEILVNKDATDNARCDDHWAGDKLLEEGIKPHHDPRFTIFQQGPAPRNDIISTHTANVRSRQVFDDLHSKALKISEKTIPEPRC